MLNLDAIKARLASITPGDYVEITDDGKVIICGVLPLFVLTKRAGSTEDTEFIAHAPADIRALVGEVERLYSAVGLALEYAYDESNGHCRGCTVDDGRHDANCPVAAIEKISGSEK